MTRSDDTVSFSEQLSADAGVAEPVALLHPEPAALRPRPSALIAIDVSLAMARRVTSEIDVAIAVFPAGLDDELIADELRKLLTHGKRAGQRRVLRTEAIEQVISFAGTQQHYDL